MRLLPLACVLLATCTATAGPTPAPVASPAAPLDGPADSAAKTRADEPAGDPPPSGGRCDPLPRAGDPCGAGDSYCVESWGEPGGWSSALWCRDGRWTREQERNLPVDEP